MGAAFGCPFEGCVAPARMLDLAAQVQRAAPDEIVLADTMGVGVPRQVRELVAGVRALAAVAGCHFHNTRNTGFTNALAAVEAGATVLDASLGGLGGCPFAPRATGNIATEDLVYLLRGMGYELSAEHRPAGAHRVRCVAVRSARQGSPRPSLQSWRLRAGGIVKGGATMAYRLGVGTSGESGVLSPP